MRHRGFEGWYFKHQKGGDVVAFIPGRAESGAFVQMITPERARQFDVPSLLLDRGVIQAGENRFSRHGCHIDLPGVRGDLQYGPLTPLRSDIMGPFRFLPMECRHGVLSMGHSLRGSLTIDGAAHCFDGGMGYLEKDSGTSFPSSYLWLQCSDFDAPCSLMVSVARIPFCGMHFTGCICAIVADGREYRLATYRGVRVLAADRNRLQLSQGPLLLEVSIASGGEGHPLRAPVGGVMSGTIRETIDVPIHMRLFSRGTPVLELSGRHAAFELVPPSS